MRVYHGSYMLIREIYLSKSELQRDFGQGFYVTKYRQQAEFWAFRKGLRRHTDGVVTEFEFDENVFYDKKFNVLRFEYYTDEWFDFVIQNRESIRIIVFWILEFIVVGVCWIVHRIVETRYATSQ